eukprot:766026-Hanusia_phi.AAC.2
MANKKRSIAHQQRTSPQRSLPATRQLFVSAADTTPPPELHSFLRNRTALSCSKEAETHEVL